jgi:polyphosphate kinase 2 (PPK2 family)
VKITCNARGPGRRTNSDGNVRGLRGRATSHPIRSYYEEVFVVRVHQDLLKQQRIPATLLGNRIWDERLPDIAHFEDYLTRQGTIILKFFLHVSCKEQKKRFMERLDEPQKHWKFSTSDIKRV